MKKDGLKEIPRREDELRDPVEGLFPEKEYIVKREVPFGLKRVDLIFKSKSNGRDIIAVELKLRNWKRAVWQAVHNRQIATRSYIAVPEGSAPHVDRAMLRSLGVGLIVTDMKRARILLPAHQSRYVNEKFAREISSLVESPTHV